MKKLLIIFLSTVLLFEVNGQVTQKPTIDKQSQDNVLIHKVEITKDFTIFHMEFVDNYQNMLENNPDLENQLRFFNEGPIRLGGQTISINSNTRILLGDGKSYSFVKTANIPVSPERLEVVPGKKYLFKVYFEQIPAGYETIDLLEHDKDQEGETNYWNFRGIKINNPKNRVVAQESELEFSSQNFRIFGKIIDGVSEKPINAKIVCIDAETNEVIDSLQTSRTGKYEFFVDKPKVFFKVTSPTFDSIEEDLNVKAFLSRGSFEKDFFLYNDKQPIDRGEELEDNTFKLDKVYFPLGESRILEDSYKQLDALVQHLKDNPDLRIQIEGHTDNQGDAQINQKLSLDRAFNVREYLISKGINGSRVKFKGYGSTKPISPNDTEDNRQKNRRVEYTFLD